MDGRDIGRLIKYLILATIVYSYLFSGTLLYFIVSILSYVMYIVTYPIRAMFADFSGFGFNIDIGSLYSNLIGQQAVQETVHTTVQETVVETIQHVVENNPVQSLGSPSGIDFTTTIGKIIRALIGP